MNKSGAPKRRGDKRTHERKQRQSKRIKEQGKPTERKRTDRFNKAGRNMSRKMDTKYESDNGKWISSDHPKFRRKQGQATETVLIKLRKALEKPEIVGRDQATRELASALGDASSDPIQKKFFQSIGKGANPRETGSSTARGSISSGKYLTDSVVESVASVAGKDSASVRRITEAIQRGERPQLKDLRKDVAKALTRYLFRSQTAMRLGDSAAIAAAAETPDIIDSAAKMLGKEGIATKAPLEARTKPTVKDSEVSFTNEDWKRFLNNEQSKIQGDIMPARPDDEIRQDIMPARPGDKVQVKLAAESERQIEKPSLTLKDYLRGKISKGRRDRKPSETKKTPRERTEDSIKRARRTLADIPIQKKGPFYEKAERALARKARSRLISVEKEEEPGAAKLEQELERRRRIIDFKPEDLTLGYIPSAEIPQRKGVQFVIYGRSEYEKAIEDVKKGPFKWMAENKESKTLIVSNNSQKVIVRDNHPTKVLEKSTDVWRGSMGTDRPSTNAPGGKIPGGMTYVVDREKKIWYSARTGKAIAKSPSREGMSVSKVIIEGKVTGKNVYDIFLPHYFRTPHRRMALKEVVGKEKFLIVRVPYEGDMMPMDADRSLKISEAFARSARYIKGAAKNVVHKMFKNPIQTGLMMLLDKGLDKLGLPVTRYLFGSQTAMRLGDAAAIAMAAETPDEIDLAAKIFADELAGWAVGKAMGKAIKGTAKGTKRVINVAKAKRAEARMKAYGPRFQYFKNKYLDGDAVTAEKVLMGKNNYDGDIELAIKSQEFKQRLTDHVLKGRQTTPETLQKLKGQADQRYTKNFETLENKKARNLVKKMEIEKPGLKMSRGKGNPLRQHLYGDPEHARDFAKINGIEAEYKRITDYEQQLISPLKKTEIENLQRKGLDPILDELARRRVTERLENKGKVVTKLSDNVVKNEKKSLRKIFKEKSQEEGRESLINELAQRRAEEKAFTIASKLYNELILNIATKALARSDTVLFKADYHGHPDFGGKNLGTQWNLEYTTKNGRRALITWKENGQILNTLDVKRSGTKVGKKKDGSPLRVPDPRHTFQNRQFVNGNEDLWLRQRGEKK